MTQNYGLNIAVLMAVSFGAALAALWALSWLRQRNTSLPAFADPHRAREIAFLFEDDHLINATEEGHEMIGAAASGPTDVHRLANLLAPKFSDLVNCIDELPDHGTIDILAKDGSMRLTGTWNDGLTRIEVTEKESAERTLRLDALSITAMEEEIQTLRATANGTPFLMWRQQNTGNITWANESYLNLASNLARQREFSAWPPPVLFDLQNTTDDGTAKLRRLSLQVPGEANPRWFECCQSKIGDDSMFTAVPADNLIGAETALRDFVQTLTKTFAHLPVGLAIFDKQRRLTLFNPALSDLTSLRPDFLSSRPTLQRVLDKLRERKMIPEPRDYKSWRQNMYDLEAAAIQGTYEETWPLASGQTYRVVGRPHPDGALAFLLEDISAEVSLTRRYRAELETGQAVIDTLDEAIAVFSSNGTMTVSNVAYGKLWSTEVLDTLSATGIIEETKIWAARCAPTPVWGDIREFVGSIHERVEWTAEVVAANGQVLTCRFQPLSGGSTLVGFKSRDAQSSATPFGADRQPGVVEGTLAI